MPANQLKPKMLNPNGLNLSLVATYDRLVNAPLNRAWENVLDWAHLPYLHESTFDHIELDEAGDWGWRTWSDAAHTDHVELTIADEERYVARTYLSGQQVSEIWTTLTANGEQTRVHVEFYFPDVDTQNMDAFGKAIVLLYTQLWDEDEAMMRQRHLRLLEDRDKAADVALGSAASLHQQLTSGETIIFQLQKREYQLRERDGVLIAHSTICPHLMGPLTDLDIATGRLRCPWHGYEFDLATGECVFPNEAECRLAPQPKLQEKNGNIIASL
ncbi:MAG: nitrite reductase/ring-hydroxylating ferredoxin subunit [Halioglobus sp.]|jgi:nitrite reductase/ring-hydroxylating ferredoxin subunit